MHQGLSRTVAIQVSGCRECESLLLPWESGRYSICVRCEPVEDLLGTLAELKEEVERLRAIRDCEQESDWWSSALACQRERCQGDIPQLAVDALPCPALVGQRRGT